MKLSEIQKTFLLLLKSLGYSNEVIFPVMLIALEEEEWMWSLIDELEKAKIPEQELYKRVIDIFEEASKN